MGATTDPTLAAVDAVQPADGGVYGPRPPEGPGAAMFEPMKTGMSLPPAGVPFGKYRLDYRLGQGGMGEVFKGHLVGLGGFDKTVVIKRILRSHLADPEFVNMFLDEARLVALLSHPNIAQVFEIDAFQGLPYLAMEYVAGPTFFGMIREAHRRHDVRMGCIAKIMSKVCDGLHHAHNARDGSGQPLGIVHRDVSPPNILVSVEGVPKLVDFGVAMARGRMSSSSPGLVKGKLRYVAPEQIRGEPLCGRADVFSAGVCLYEATTGRRPFDGKSEAEIMHAVLEGRFVKPSKLVSEYPPELEAVVNWALKTDPAQRCPSAKAMQEALESFVTEGEYRARTQDVAEWIAQLFPDTGQQPELRYVAPRTQEPSPSPRAATPSPAPGAPAPVSLPPPLPADSVTAEPTAPMAAPPTAAVWDAEPGPPAPARDAPSPPEVSVPGFAVEDDMVQAVEAAPAPEAPALPPVDEDARRSAWRVMLGVGSAAVVVGGLWVAGASVVIWAAYQQHGSSPVAAVEELARNEHRTPAPAREPPAPVAPAPVALAAVAPAPVAPAAPVANAAPEPPPAAEPPAPAADEALPPAAAEAAPPVEVPAPAPAARAEPRKAEPRRSPEPAARPRKKGRPEAAAASDPSPTPPAPAPQPAAAAAPEERDVAATPSEGVVQDPNMARNTLHLAQMLFNNGALPKALRTARRAAGQDPSFAAAHALVGAILAAQGECPAARQAFQTALALDRADKVAREGLASCVDR
ncbi:MAG: protein kinase [Deltaproteobacteria bacterium]|nr:protein kinase [Deltaproteobacteria bacterium]